MKLVDVDRLTKNERARSPLTVVTELYALTRLELAKNMFQLITSTTHATSSARWQ
jgi:hypothetical protein